MKVTVSTIERSPIALNFIIYNHHDNFTNLTVRWFRNDNMSRATSSNEEISHIQNEYILFQDNASNPSLTIGNNINCPAGPLYRDFYFSSDKNGYYWCQIVVNNSISQPSHNNIILNLISNHSVPTLYTTIKRMLQHQKKIYHTLLPHFQK